MLKMTSVELLQVVAETLTDVLDIDVDSTQDSIIQTLEKLKSGEIVREPSAVPSKLELFVLYYLNRFGPTPRPEISTQYANWCGSYAASGSICIAPHVRNGYITQTKSEKPSCAVGKPPDVLDITPHGIWRLTQIQHFSEYLNRNFGIAEVVIMSFLRDNPGADPDAVIEMRRGFTTANNASTAINRLRRLGIIRTEYRKPPRGQQGRRASYYLTEDGLRRLETGKLELPEFRML